MRKESPKKDTESIKDTETKQFEHNPIGIMDNKFMIDGEKSLDKIKSLLSLRQAKLSIDNKGYGGLPRALVKIKEGQKEKIIFMTQWPDEIEELKKFINPTSNPLQLTRFYKILDYSSVYINRTVVKN